MQSESCMYIVFVCSRKSKGGGGGGSKGHSNHWQWHISSTTKKERIGSFDALVPTSAQVYV